MAGQEILIPMHLVPPSILQQLMDIGKSQQAQPAATAATTSSPASPLSSKTVESLSTCKHDGDVFSSAKVTDVNSNEIVHVLKPGVTSVSPVTTSELGDSPTQQTCDDVVRVLGSSDGVSLTDGQGRDDVTTLVQHESVVSVLSPPSSFSASSSSLSPSTTAKEEESRRQLIQQHGRLLSPKCVQSVPTSPSSPGTVLCKEQSGPSFRWLCRPPRPQALSPVETPPGPGAEKCERHGPSCESGQYEDVPGATHTPTKHFQKVSVHDASRQSAEAVSSASPVSVPASSQSERRCSDEKAFPSPVVTPSAESGQRSPQLATPESPEDTGRRVTAEVFTFDDRSCAEERFRQMMEELQRLQDQQVQPSNPRQPSSVPTTPRKPSPSTATLTHQRHYDLASPPSALSRVSSLTHITPSPRTPQNFPGSPLTHTSPGPLPSASRISPVSRISPLSHGSPGTYSLTPNVSPASRISRLTLASPETLSPTPQGSRICTLTHAGLGSVSPTRHASAFSGSFAFRHAAHCSPQSERTDSSVPSSPVRGREATPRLQRPPMGDVEYSPHRRESTSPYPRKKLEFDAAGSPYPPRSPRQPLSQRSYVAEFHPQPRQNSFSVSPLSSDASGAPYRIPSPRPFKSASGSIFTIPAFRPKNGQNSERTGFRTPEFQERVASLAALRRGAGERNEVDRQDLFYEDESVVCELQNCSSPLGGRLALKRRHDSKDGVECDDILTCTCALAERNLLLMAEGAYKRIRRLNNSAADFERFRGELAQTNNILRESIDILKHIRDVCDHLQQST